MHRVRSASLRSRRVRIAFGVIALLAIAPLALAQVPPATQGTLDRIQATGRIRIGYRSDARPLSYRDETGKPAGYSVDLGQRVAAATMAELGLSTLPIDWVPVTVETRYSALQKGEIDLLCGAESMTLTRRGDVAFSIATFPGGIGALFRGDAPSQLNRILAGEPPKSGPTWRGNAGQVLRDQTFSVVAGTTSEKWLAGKLDEFKLTATVVPVDGYETGIKRLLDRQTNVFFGDRAILMDATMRNPSADDLILHDRLFTCEPQALALARGDEGFRLVVDRALSRFYSTEEFRQLFAKWFGEPSEKVLAFFQWNALPE